MNEMLAKILELVAGMGEMQKAAETLERKLEIAVGIQKLLDAADAIRGR
jgi:hypothetical protein